MATLPKFKDYDPVMNKHGIEYVAAAGGTGIGVQAITWTTNSTNVLTFATAGLMDMASATYTVLAQNITDPLDPVTDITKTTSSVTLTGPDENDVLEVIIIGQLADQNKDS